MAKGCEVLVNAAPDPTLAQPSRVIVTEAVGASTTYALYYDFHLENGDFPMLADARLGPESALALRVSDGDSTSVLVAGPVTRQHLSIVNGGGGSILEVVGADVLVELGREAKVHVWPSTTDEDAIGSMLDAAGLAATVVLPSPVVHDEAKHALVQRESDLHLIRRLVRRNGCWLWLEYDRVTARPTVRVQRPPVGAPSALDLVIFGPQRNTDAVTIAWDVERVVATDADARDVFGASDIDGSASRSPLGTLAKLGLADIVTKTRKARLSMPVDDAGDLLHRSGAALIEEGWFVQASVSVSARRLKRVVRANTVVTLHGAGSRHSGAYLVSHVVHRIDDDDHWMDVTLVRNGWNPTP